MTREEARALMNSLPPRRREAALLMAEGLSNKQIARRLNISPDAAADLTKYALRALGVNNRVRLARIVWLAGEGD